ncbi:MAG: hypothetical protein RLZZ04_2452 [Cyanobacteriota bacterium]|jgi:hypothetical protein
MTLKRLSQPIDKIAIALIAFLTLIIGLLLWSGNACQDHCLFNAGGRVNDFSWQNKTIAGEDRAFILTFNRPIDRASVEQNLTITPPLPGKISWSGLRMAYTLETPAPYGETYHLALTGARDRYANQTQPGDLVQPFTAEFHSRDRVLAYIGSQGSEQGRLIQFNWTKQQKSILTPENLTVFDFEPYPQREGFLFSAADVNQGETGLQGLQLYTVVTNLDTQKAKPDNPKLELVLDNQEYQNNKFDLAQDGKTIVVQRLNRKDPNNYGLWKIVDHQLSQLITDAQTGDFLIAPDSQTVAVAKGEGIALLPLETNAKVIDFLPKFGQVLDFTDDGTGAAMVNYNTDNVKLRGKQSLVYVNNLGVQKELFNTDGSIQNCQFSPTATHLYCWLTELTQGEVYIEKPYLAKINLKTLQTETLVNLPKYQDSKISVAPDGLGVLFERLGGAYPYGSPNNQALGIEPSTTDNRGNSIWLAIPNSSQANATAMIVEQLPFVGFRPQWLP